MFLSLMTSSKSIFHLRNITMGPWEYFRTIFLKVNEVIYFLLAYVRRKYNLFHLYEVRTIFTILLWLNSFKKCIELQNTIKQERKKIRVVALLNFRALLHFATNSTFVLMIKIVIIYFYCLAIFFGIVAWSLFMLPLTFMYLYLLGCVTLLLLINRYQHAL